MKKQTLITWVFVIGIIVLFSSVMYFFGFNKPSEKLCVYKIPNIVKFSCPADNDTRIVNANEVTLFEYNNALSQGCTFNSTIEDYGYRYEIYTCDDSIPFPIV